MQYKPEIKHASGRYLRKPPLTAMPFFYSSGEEVRKGDRVLLHGEAGEIEFIADPAESPDHWFVKDQGGGIMVLEPKVFGRLFISKPETDEYLTFMSRQTKQWNGLDTLESRTCDATLIRKVRIKKSAINGAVPQQLLEPLQ